MLRYTFLCFSFRQLTTSSPVAATSARQVLKPPGGKSFTRISRDRRRTFPWMTPWDGAQWLCALNIHWIRIEIPSLPSSQLDSFTQVNDVDVLDGGPHSRAWYFYEEFTHQQMTHLSRAVAKIWETGVRCSEMSLNFEGEMKQH